MAKQNYNKENTIFTIVIIVAIVGTIGLAVLFSGNNSGDKNSNINLTGKISINHDDHIRGDKDAPVTMIEFSDFQCPYCKKFSFTILRVLKNYPKQVRLIYRHFPLRFHRNAEKAAEAAECAGAQGKFWGFVDKAFANSQADGGGLNSSDLKKYAQELGLDINKFDSCLTSGQFTAKIRADRISGQAVGIKGTPGTVLIDRNGQAQLISGAASYRELKAKLEAALK